MSRSDFSEGGFFGFVSNREAGEVSIGGKFAGAAFFEEIFCEIGEISLYGGLDDRVVWLISLDNDFGTVEMSPTDAADDLGKKLKSSLLGGEIGERKASVGLDDADGSKEGEIEPAGEGLGADEDVNIAGFDVIIEGGEVFRFFIIPVKTGDSGLWEEPRKLGFEELGTKAFVNYAGMMAFWAARRHLFRVAAEVTT